MSTLPPHVPLDAAHLLSVTPSAPPALLPACPVQEAASHSRPAPQPLKEAGFLRSYSGLRLHCVTERSAEDAVSPIVPGTSVATACLL